MTLTDSLALGEERRVVRSAPRPIAAGVCAAFDLTTKPARLVLLMTLVPHAAGDDRFVTDIADRIFAAASRAGFIAFAAIEFFPLLAGEATAVHCAHTDFIASVFRSIAAIRLFTLSS